MHERYGPSMMVTAALIGGLEMAFRFSGKNHAGQEWRAVGAIFVGAIFIARG